MTNVLIIDDDAQIRRLVSMVLKDEGFEVHTASDGIEGLDLVPAVDPDVIVLDMRMPGLDGAGFLDGYRTRFERRAPVVLLSGDTSDRPRELGVSIVLRKPFDIDELVDAVRFALT